MLIGYEIAYTEKGQNKWMNVTSNTVLRREKLIGGLKKFSEYEFKVAGKTSAGIGVFSPAITYKTKEDGMILIILKVLFCFPSYQGAFTLNNLCKRLKVRANFHDTNTLECSECKIFARAERSLPHRLAPSLFRQ